MHVFGLYCMFGYGLVLTDNTWPAVGGYLTVLNSIPHALTHIMHNIYIPLKVNHDKLLTQVVELERRGEVASLNFT